MNMTATAQNLTEVLTQAICQSLEKTLPLEELRESIHSFKRNILSYSKAIDLHQRSSNTFEDLCLHVQLQTDKSPQPHHYKILIIWALAQI